jgi:putative cell wall-binding protein
VPSSARRSWVGALAVALAAVLFVPVATVAATPTATLQGTVTLEGGGVASGWVSVLSTGGSNVVSASLDAAGHYSVDVASGARYLVQATYTGTTDHVRTSFAGGGFSWYGAATVTVSGPTTRDHVVPRAGRIVGTLTGVDGPLRSGYVAVGNHGAASSPESRISYDVEAQTYSITGLPPGLFDVTLSSNDSFGTGSRYEYQRENGVSVASGGVTVRVDATLRRTAAISGRVTWPSALRDSSRPLGDVTASPAWSLTPEEWQVRPVWTRVADDGTFSFGDLAAGPWGLCATPDFAQTSLRGACADGTAPVVVELAAHQVVEGVEVGLLPAGSVSGRVVSEVEYTTPAPAWSPAVVTLFAADDPRGGSLSSASVEQDGSFRADHLAPGSYVARIEDTSERSDAHGWWPDAPSVEFAEEITVTAGATTDMGTGTLSDDVAVERLSGSDRYATAVEVSEALFPQGSPPAPVVYVANGTGYADALSAGPAAAAEGGGLLMVSRDEVPTVVADELRRLRPERVVLVGGSAAISSSVEARLAGITGVTPERRAGADRYATSLAVNEPVFGGGDAPAELFLATGRGFADALAAGPAAAHLGGPVLLVDGTGPLTAAQTDFVRGTPKIDVVGGPAAVSDATIEAMGPVLPGIEVRRLGGADRYATAASVNEHAFRTVTDRAYLATGAGFADALGGGVLAAADDAPLYLTTASCVPEATLTDLSRVAPNIVTVLGGRAVVSDDVLDGLPAC